MERKNFQSLQLYRGVAAFLVVLYHSTPELQRTFFKNAFVSGYTGVQFFFVLSGFIIYFIHSRDLSHPERIKTYLLKRFIRVYPIYWILLAVALVMIFISSEFAGSHKRTLSVIVQSFLLFPQENWPVIDASWTLCYEIIFYLLFALAMWLGKRFAIIFSILWTLAILAFNSAVELQFPYKFIFNPLNLYFLLGCISAHIVMTRKIERAWQYIGAGTVIFLGAGAYISITLTQTPMLAEAVCGVASFLLIIGGAGYESFKNVKIPAAFLIIGNSSYSLYLSHGFTIKAYRIITAKLGIAPILPPLLNALLMISLCVIVGIIIFRYLEIPVSNFCKNKLLPTSRARIIENEMRPL
ncbi:MAG TPA: acyltransferase [Patescibacteria group bacterium]|nr:acyltransferase [Patescibacteria group bacterium]